jgi:hypothetical protein
MIEGPILYETPNRACTEEERSFDGRAYALNDPDHRLDVAPVRSPTHDHTNLQLIANNGPRERFRILESAGAGAGKADVQAVDAQIIH